ncbi:hypothetical protein ACR3I8_03165 [Priestia flexa]|nr:hypothetical protein [Priestia flexa]USY56820.1 hypothetical protein NIZ91_09285 [Bacillus sp. 1780r2a1]
MMLGLVILFILCGVELLLAAIALNQKTDLWKEIELEDFYDFYDLKKR